MSGCSCLQGQLNAALEGLLNVEKQQRLAEDITGTKLACLAIIDVLYAAKDWKLLNEHILLLAKRRSQLKQVHIPASSILFCLVFAGHLFALFSDWHLVSRIMFLLEVLN